MTEVDLHLVEKQLKRLPYYIVEKLTGWIRFIEKYGVRAARLNRGYHDEPLQGQKFGQRSIRLSKSYRAIYSEHKNGEIEIILIEEVNKHDY